MTVVSPSMPPPPAADDEVYAVKRVQFLGKPVAYICQNINGPCPLLAISNLLLLRGHISIDAHVRNGGIVAASDLIAVVRKRLLDANPPLPESDELGRLTQQKTLEDVTQLLPSLLVGLDVNVRFHSITDFEYTVACAVFDMLDIALVHGWLLDLQDEKTLEVVQNKTYNELIERLVDYRGVMMTEQAAQQPSNASADGKESEKADATQPSETPVMTEAAASSATSLDAAESGLAKLQIDVRYVDETASAEAASQSPRSQGLKSPSQKTVDVIKRERQLSDADAADTATALLEEGPVLEEFFAASASQLTYYGLVKLHEDLRERQLAVFFRNNHFSTLFKIDGALYLLVTDAGYLDEPTVVWERLNEIDGDTEYYDESFCPLNAAQTRQQTIFQQQEDARRRELEEEAPPLGEADSAPVSEAYTDESRTTSQEELPESEQDADYLLALKLQQEEEAQARAARVPQSPRAAAPLSSPSRAAAGTTVAMPHSPVRFVPREPSDGYDSQPPSQGPNSSSEGDAYTINANGELVLSEAELQAQREAELYYQQQRQLQRAQGQAPPGVYPHQPDSMRQEYQQRQSNYAPNRAAPPRGDARRQSGSDCVVM